MSEIEDQTAALLAALWVKNRPLIEERLAALDAAAATDGALGEDARQQAESAAHKLAGSLGMYGYDDGTRIARLLEQLVESSTPEPERLRRLTAELRATIFPDS